MTSEAQESDVRSFKLSKLTRDMIRNDVKTAASYEIIDQDLLELSEKAPAFVIFAVPGNRALVGVEIERWDDSPLTYETHPVDGELLTTLNVKFELRKKEDGCYWCIEIGDYKLCIRKPFCT